MAQRVGRGIALLFHDPGTRKRVSGQPHALAAIYPRRDPLIIVQEAMWAPGQVWTGGISRTHRDSIPDRPARKIPYIRQCNIRMLARSYTFVSVLLIVEVSLFHTKMPDKATSAWPSKCCLSLYWVPHALLFPWIVQRNS